MSETPAPPPFVPPDNELDDLLGWILPKGQTFATMPVAREGRGLENNREIKPPGDNNV